MSLQNRSSMNQTKKLDTGSVCVLQSNGSICQKPSPDRRASLWAKEERIAGAHVESCVPGIDFPNGLVDPAAVGAMGIGENVGAQRLGSPLIPTDLRECQEEPLVAGQAVYHWSCPAAQGDMVGVPGELQAADIGEVLPQGQVPIDL